MRLFLFPASKTKIKDLIAQDWVGGGVLSRMFVFWRDADKNVLTRISRSHESAQTGLLCVVYGSIPAIWVMRPRVKASA